jgi:predicted transcriptional regulator
MANVTIELPDDLSRSLASIAAAQHKSVQQLALERLRSLVDAAPEARLGSAMAVLQAMQEPPHLSGLDVDELDAAIAAGRIAVQTRELFQG